MKHIVKMYVKHEYEIRRETMKKKGQRKYLCSCDDYDYVIKRVAEAEAESRGQVWME